MKESELWVTVKNDLQAAYLYTKGARQVRFGSKDTTDRDLVITMSGAMAHTDSAGSDLSVFYGTDEEPQVLVDIYQLDKGDN